MGGSLHCCGTPDCGPISSYPASAGLAEPDAVVPDTWSERLERKRWPTLALCAALFAWLWRHFVVNGLGLGFNAAVTHESRRIHALRGMALYGLAFLKAVWRHFESPPLSITFDGKEQESPTLALYQDVLELEG